MRKPRSASARRSNGQASGRRGGICLTLTLALVAVAGTVKAADDQDWREVRRGRELFMRDWRPNDPRCHGGDGLGPIYNATSCVACHSQGAPGGGGSVDTNDNLLNLGKFQRITTVGTPQTQSRSPQTQRGQQGSRVKDNSRSYTRIEAIERFQPALRDSASVVLHNSGTDPRYDAWRAAILELKRGGPFQAESDGLSKFPDRAVLQVVGNRGFASITQRNSPPLFGMGLIDSVPDEVILAAAKEATAISPNAHGRIHRLKSGRVGKFGWKAQVGSLQEFVVTACANELGLESPGHHQAPSPFAPEAQAKVPDLTVAECDSLVAYVRDLPAPAVYDLGAAGNASAEDGRRIFGATGCVSCHRAQMGEVVGIYSDLLLHDMGPGLNDSGQYYGSSSSDSESSDSPKSTEWRTPPLWGFRDSGPYLHDGRAATLEAAVELHGGEAQQSTQRFKALSILERFQLETFLKSLAAPVPPKELQRRQEIARVEWDRETAAAAAEFQAAERQREAELEQIRQSPQRDVQLEGTGSLWIAQQTEKNGRPRAALKLYQEVIRRHPNTPAANMALERIKALAN
jgi:CxxC motif-containing protein (DUF1111 family)